MKIGKLSLGAAVLALILMSPGCKKKEANVEPVADTETQTAVDAMWATFLITDVDQLCGFMGEDQFTENFYTPSAAADGVNYQVIRDTTGRQKAVTWRNGPILCKDGRKREGSLFMYYKKDAISNPDANANSRYYRDFGFVGNLAFQDFKVDGWQINLYDPANRAYVYNKMTTDKYDPTSTRLTWLIAGKFLIQHPTDASKNIVWEGQLWKVLTNSTDKDIFAVTKQGQIRWVRPDLKPAEAALIEYYTEKPITGFTGTNKPFSLTVNKATPLVRDFLCSGDPVAAVTASVSGTTTEYLPVIEEHHPFIKGIVSFTTGLPTDNKYPRQIYVGNEATPDQPQQCDNTGVVLIKGNSYPVNFRK